MYLKPLGKPGKTSCICTLAHCMFRIMSGTIKDNILFSHHYDDTFYNLVLDGENHCSNSFAPADIGFAACALRPDLALLSNGDMTEVGEKGITVGDMFGTA